MPSFLKAILHSYSLLFFSQHRGFAMLLVVVTFGHPWVGAMGLGATLLAVAGARLLGFNREWTDLGAYSFNALLVGLLLATWYAPSWALVGMVVVGAGLALLLSVAVGGWLASRGLPALSLPFVVVVWLLISAAGQVPGICLNEHGIYWLNDLYALGGPRLVAAAQWAATWPWPPLVAIYLRALSSVVLQDSALGGLLVVVGLLWHSRIAFSLSVLAFGAAYGFALLTGTLTGPSEAYNLGANYMMTAIAIGSVFVVPSAASYGLALLSVPVTAVLLGGLGAGLAHAGLPLLSLPYCATALLFLYVLLLRERPAPGLALTPVQRYSPEANLYAYVLDRQRLAYQHYAPLTLPFLGAWQCSQGYTDGTGPTHQGDWGQALDFVITDADGRTYTGAGTVLSDFYCYNKPLLAPADGIIELVIQHLPDNAIGEVNIEQNWGNTVVIRHNSSLFTQLSHLRSSSVPVKAGDTVRRGDIVGYCGSSGRSPEPHLHFQVQATPYVGSRTLPYPLAYYLAIEKRELTPAIGQAQVLNSQSPKKASRQASAVQNQAATREVATSILLEESSNDSPKNSFGAALTAKEKTSPSLSAAPVLHHFAVPQAGDIVSTPPPLRALRLALAFPPGYALDVWPAAGSHESSQRWEVFTDAYNKTYLHCQQTGAVAYFEHDEAVFYFTAYYGPESAWLYDFYLAAYRVPLVQVPAADTHDTLPLTVLRQPVLKWAQDIVAPFVRFVVPTFRLAPSDAVDGLIGNSLALKSQVAFSWFGRTQVLREAELQVRDGAVAALQIRQGNQLRQLEFSPAEVNSKGSGG